VTPANEHDEGHTDERDDGHPGVLRVGVAGYGSMGRNHVRNLLARDDVTLVAVAESEESARLAVGQQAPDVATFADPHAMLASIDMDAVVVATPTTLHLGIALDAIERRVAVLVEKPIAPTVAEGREMVRSANATGVLLQVGHIERFNPAVLELARRLRAGALSRIFSVRTIRGGPTPERIQDVGVGIDLATHDLDVICHLLGAQPTRIYAEATRHVHTVHEDLVYGLLTFPGGVLGQIDVNWLTPEKQRRVVVLGEEGMFEVDYLSQALLFTRGRDDLAPTYLDGYAPMIRGERRALPVAPAEPLRRELDAFFTAVRSGGPAAVSGEEGVRAVALAAMMLRSAMEHRPLEIGVGDLR
jgi:UDP-N-acetylglucosamine 3-dehydrogenase